MPELSPLEARVVLLLRNLAAHEVLEIRRDGPRVAVILKSTLREIFAADEGV